MQTRSDGREGREALRLCRCGNPINVQELREQSRDKAEAIHLTKTLAGMSQWLKGKLRVRGSAVSGSATGSTGANSLARDPSMTATGEFNIWRFFALAMGSSGPFGLT